MSRLLLLVGVVASIGLCGGTVTISAQEIQRGTLKRLDLEARQIVVTRDGRDWELTLTERTQVLDASGKTLAEKLSGFKVGSEVFWRAMEREGEQIALGLKLAGPPGARPAERRPVSPAHSHLKPLDELATGKYQGFLGGLYPEGKNTRPDAHEAAGLDRARQIQPLDAQGGPSADGRVVLLSIGMSNTSQASQGFQEALRGFEALHPRLVFVNGAVGGMTAAAIRDPDDGGRGAQYWAEVDNRLERAGVTRAQVQAVWIKQANAGPRQGFPDYARELQADLARIVRVIAARFPNAKLGYLSSRTYGGFATTGLNPEPYAYESAFAVKWLIEEQIKGNPELNYDPARGPVQTPWLSWGPYLWANGSAKRVCDGFAYEPTDFAPDGTHHSPAGSRKVGQLMLDFFRHDSTTKPWFVGGE